MNQTEVPPVLSMLSAARNIFISRRKFRLLFLYTILTGILILSFSACLFIYIYTIGTTVADFTLQLVVILCLILGFPLFLLTPFVIIYTKTNVKNFQSFVSSFYPIFLRTEIDLFLPTSENFNDSVISMMRTFDVDLKKSKINPNLPQKVKDISNSFDVILKSKRKVAAVKVVQELDDQFEKSIAKWQTDLMEISRAVRKSNSLLVVVSKGEKSKISQNIESIRKLRTIVLNSTENGFSLIFVSN